MDAQVKIDDLLRPYVKVVGQVPGGDQVLNRMRELMKVVDNPQQELKIVHIAGTSGKTSTAYYLSELLNYANLKIGLTVSPHIDNITERVQINGQKLAQVKFLHLLEDLIRKIEKAKIMPTYFELLYAFSIWVFASENVDYAVIETGVGGLYDATNIAARPDKLCLITDIGIDHTKLLGHTIKAIATQKAGIIHKYNPVITYAQDQEIMDVIMRQVRDCSSQLVVIDRLPSDPTLLLPDMPNFQKHNWWMAYNAYQFLCQRDNLSELSGDVIAQTQHLVIPARMQAKEFKKKTVILDGAHNLQKLSALADAYLNSYPNVRTTVILSFKQGKEYAEAAEIIHRFADQVIVTAFKSSVDLPITAVKPQLIAVAFRGKGISAIVEDNMDKALALAIKSNTQNIVITGSFFLISQIRASHPELI